MQKCVQHAGVREFGWIKAPDGLERALGSAGLVFK